MLEILLRTACSKSTSVRIVEPIAQLRRGENWGGKGFFEAWKKETQTISEYRQALVREVQTLFLWAGDQFRGWGIT